VSGSVAAPELAAQRALATFRAIRGRRLYDRRLGLYGTRQRPCGRRRYEHLWPFANAWSAVAALAGLPGARPEALDALRSFHGAVSAYRRPTADDPAHGGFESGVVPPMGRGGDRYFDDNAWLGLALVRHYDETGDERVLELARQAFGFVVSGWSGDAGARHPGGVRWKAVAASRARHTCATAPGAQLGVLLFERTGEGAALDWAVRAYAWERRALLGPGGLYLDRIDPDGTVEPTVWTYNQGSMIGAGTLLHRATGDPTYLSQALSTCTASLRRFGLSALVEQGPAFNAIYFRNQFLLATSLGTGDGEGIRRWVAASAADYGEELWRRGRDRRTGLFGAPGSRLNASAPMIEVYTLLGGGAPRP
jgi:Glycosyl hydrolase family 76